MVKTWESDLQGIAKTSPKISTRVSTRMEKDYSRQKSVEE